MSSGISSYEQLARECKVTRNTVYRRIAVLEEKGIIKKIVHCIVDYNKLDIVPICLGVTVPEAKQKEVAALLRGNKEVKFLWRTFGSHNIVLVVFCSKGSEGETIHNLTEALENLGVTATDLAVGFKMEKMDFTPFCEEAETAVEELEEEPLFQIIESKH